MDLGVLRILVVDDNRHAAEIVRSILVGAGCRQVREVTSAQAAFKAMQEEAIDLLILDQNLGAGGEGIELVKRVRNDPTSPNAYLPILMLTGYADQRLVKAARDAGVSEFLVKPFTVQGLMSRLDALIFHPRPFVRAQSYFGPDRRRRRDPERRGPERRGGGDGGRSGGES